MDNEKIKTLGQQLTTVGPRLAAKLLAAGIDSPEKLKEPGAQAAFAKMYSSGGKCGDYNAAYLFALEGAIRDCDQLEIPADVKQAHKRYAQSLQIIKKRG